MDSLSPNRHVKVGSTEALDVLMPEYWSGAPTLTFRRAGADIASVGFAAKRAADSITAISGTSLTGVFAGAVAGFQGPVGGLAFLVTAQDGTHAVEVAQLTATAAVLREPLPRAVVITGALPASLVWRWFSAPIPAAVTASETGTTPADWRCEYTANDGGFGTRTGQRCGGLIHVTAEKFSTGVGSEKLRYFFADLPRATPGDLSFAGPLEMARTELVAYVRYKLTESLSGRREDDIIGTDEGFQLAHARLAAAEIMRADRRSAESVEALRTQAFAAADQALATVSWYDPTGSGEGENGTPAARPALLASGSRLPARADTAPNPFGYRLGTRRG